MSFREYLHEKAEESRHNETLAYLMFLVGAICFIGGVIENLLENMSLGTQTQWFLIIPYCAQPSAGACLGLILMIGGIALVVLGVASGFNCSRDRSWYMQELRRANSVEENAMCKSGKTGMKKRSGKK